MLGALLGVATRVVPAAILVPNCGRLGTTVVTGTVSVTAGIVTINEPLLVIAAGMGVGTAGLERATSVNEDTSSVAGVWNVSGATDVNGVPDVGSADERKFG